MPYKLKPKTQRKYTLLQDVTFVNNAENVNTFIVSTMKHSQEPIYLIAGYAKPIHEQFLKPIKQTKQP